MFYGPLAESSQIKIFDSDPDAFLEMLEFIYTDSLVMTPSNVSQILYLARKYDIVSLEERSRNWIRNNMNRKNVLHLFKFLSLMDDQELLDQAWKIMDENGHYIINSNDLVNLLDESLFTSILLRDSFCCREVDAFDALIWWVKQQREEWMKDKSVDDSLPSPDERQKQVLEKLLPLIRFPLMTLKELTQIVVPTGFLSGEEVVDVLLLHRRSKDNTTRHESKFNSQKRSLGQEIGFCLNDLQSSVGSTGTLTSDGLSATDGTDGTAAAASSLVPPSRSIWGSPLVASPRTLVNHGGVLFERSVCKGSRSIQFRVYHRMFLTRIDVENIPARICSETHCLTVRVTDVDLDEVVCRTDFILKRMVGMPPRPAKFDLELSSPPELCPKVRYRIDLSFELNEDKKQDKTGFTQQNTLNQSVNGSSVYVSFDKYGKRLLEEEEMRVSQINFLI